MDYEEFLGERRRRMADLIRAVCRQLDGEPEAAPLSPPWFLPSAEQRWKRIGETEHALRNVVAEVFAAVYGANAAARIRASLLGPAKAALGRAMRTRAGSDDIAALLDHLYLAQLPALLFAGDA